MTEVAVLEKPITTYEEGRVYSFDPMRVRYFPKNPRQDVDGIEELAASIKCTEQYQPIRVVPVYDNPDYDAELDDGERRLRSCRLIQMPVKAIVSFEFSERKRYVGSVAANFCRQAHNTYEVALALKELEAHGYAQNEIANICGKSQTWVSQYLALNKLPQEVFGLLRPGVSTENSTDARKQGRSGPRRKTPLSFQIALLLVPLPTEMQCQLAKKVAGLGHAVAQRIIDQAIRGSDITLRTRKRSPSESLEALDHLIERTVHAFAKYGDMSTKELRELVSKAHPTDRKRFAHNLNALGDQCKGTAELIARTLATTPSKERVTG